MNSPDNFVDQGRGPGAQGQALLGHQLCAQGFGDTEPSQVLWERMEKQCVSRGRVLPARSSRVEEGAGRRGEC